MNVLLAFSSHDGPFTVAFNIDSLNLELKHHKNIFDAIQLCLEANKSDKKISDEFCKTFDNVVVSYGELQDEDCFINNVIKAQAEFGDPDSDEYDSRYKDISIEPPFQLDAIIDSRTFY